MRSTWPSCRQGANDLPREGRRFRPDAGRDSFVPVNLWGGMAAACAMGGVAERYASRIDGVANNVGLARRWPISIPPCSPVRIRRCRPFKSCHRAGGVWPGPHRRHRQPDRAGYGATHGVRRGRGSGLGSSTRFMDVAHAKPGWQSRPLCQGRQAQPRFCAPARPRGEPACCEQAQQAGFDRQDLTNARRSGLITSACVVSMPCG